MADSAKFMIGVPIPLITILLASIPNQLKMEQKKMMKKSRMTQTMISKMNVLLHSIHITFFIKSMLNGS